MNEINFTYNENHEQICDKLGYKCPRAYTATITDCKGCNFDDFEKINKSVGKKIFNINT